MEESRSFRRDVSLSIPTMETITIVSPFFKIVPVLYDEMAKQVPEPDNSIISARRAAVLLVKKALAEFLGTFLLIFIVLSALIMNATHDGALGLLGVATTAGLVIVVIVSSLVHVSGAHLNPAVSISMAVFGYLPRAHLAPYMAAQFLGSIAASFLANAIYRPENPGAIVATVPTLGTAETFLIEFVITFILLFVIVALVVDPKAPWGPRFGMRGGEQAGGEMWPGMGLEKGGRGGLEGRSVWRSLREKTVEAGRQLGPRPGMFFIGG
uniref:Uncharacterized protein n=1 Tax=Avena sativa TaxID=4498 RepID=A0ACD5ZZN7_AVESA